MMLGHSQGLRDRWRDAMDQALRKDRMENDGLPDISFLGSSQTLASTPHSGGTNDELRASSPTPTQDAGVEEQEWKIDPEYV